jgi:DNA topoisomerase VI subunit A
MFAANNFLPLGNIKNNGDSTKKVSESLISCELDSTVITPLPEMSPIPIPIPIPIPMVCLTDCNPHGYHIYLLYKYNCKTSIHRGEDLSNPRLKRIGLSFKDKNFISEAIANEGIPPDKTFETLNTDDLKCLKTLKNYKCNQGPHAEEMQQELNRFAKFNQKCDIQIIKNSLEKYLKWKLEDFLK